MFKLTPPVLRRLFGVAALALSVTSVHATYWNVFNIEDEALQTARTVTYAALSDMLNDTNRTGDFAPNPSGFGRNIVGSGSDNTAGGGTPLPEPASLLLVSLGMAGLAFRLRRKRAAPQPAGSQAPTVSGAASRRINKNPAAPAAGPRHPD